MIEYIGTDSLFPHPLNRQFERTGEVWENFVASVRRSGVVMPAVVRPHKKGYQVIAGHRRAAASEEAGFQTVPCVVRPMDDGEALELLLNENLQREDLTPTEEARLIEAMGRDMELPPEEIAERVSRSLTWVKTRQLMLGLGEEVLQRASVRRGEDGHLPMGSIEAILEVPDELREEALQMVLHPQLEMEALSPRQARDVLKFSLIEPWVQELAWNNQKKARLAEWRKMLKEMLPAMDGVLLVAVEWKEREQSTRGTIGAFELVSEEEKTDDAPADLKWLALAIRHGLALKIIPSGEESALVVDAGLLRQAEAVRKEYDYQGIWLQTPGEKTENPEVQTALDALEGNGEPVEDEKRETVIDQTMQHSAIIDMGAVRKVAMWAITPDADPMNAPDFVPTWARDLGVEGQWETIDRVCNWIVGLKG